MTASDMKRSHKLLAPVIISYLAMSLISCQDDLDDPSYAPRLIKEAIYEGMTEWYYWNEEVPADLNLTKYNSNEALLEDLRYKTLDKWSYLTTVDAFDKAFTGQNAGHGVGFAIGQDDRVYLTFVYEESPAGKDGWQRGWEIVEVNGKPISTYKVGNGYNLQLGADSPGVTNSFKFRLPDGTLV